MLLTLLLVAIITPMIGLNGLLYCYWGVPLDVSCDSLRSHPRRPPEDAFRVCIASKVPRSNPKFRVSRPADASGASSRHWQMHMLAAIFAALANGRTVPRVLLRRVATVAANAFLFSLSSTCRCPHATPSTTPLARRQYVPARLPAASRQGREMTLCSIVRRATSI